MRIVSKRHNHYETKQVQSVEFIKNAANDDGSFEERQQRATSHKPANYFAGTNNFAGQSAILAQIIVSREDDNVINGLNAAQTLAANAGYGEALDRKQVRMETGSFLADAA
ncbi:MAG: hypothetical protein ABJN04_07645 [Hyphomicrobiales bacterium]